MKKIIFALAIFSCFYFAACKKNSFDPDNPYGLPNATQSGKNTLGFLLNGQPWTPKGNNGTGNFSLYYDETFQGGVFNISAFRNPLNTNGNRQSLIMYGDSIQQPQTIVLPNTNKFGFSFWDEANNCTYDFNDGSTIIQSGFFRVRKLDKINRIFSAEFEIHFTKVGCSDMHITEGRFDMKY